MQLDQTRGAQPEGWRVGVREIPKESEEIEVVHILVDEE